MSALEELIARVSSLPPDQLLALNKETEAATSDMKWVPTPGPQTEGYFSEADELFYGGQAGGGKSDLAIGLALNEHEESLILREYNDDAREMGDRLVDIVGNNGWNGQLLRYKNANVNIRFGGCKDEKDKQRYKGKAHDLKVFDEIGDFTESQYEFICGWNRSASGRRCRILATGNPPTRAKGLWVIKRWGAWLDPSHPNPAQPGELRWYTTDPESGDEIEVDGRGPHMIGGEEVIARSRTFIRATLDDNPYLRDTDYKATLSSLPKELRDAYRDGKFDASLKDDPHQVIPTAWVRLAMERWTENPPKGIPMCAMAVDAAGGGMDNMVIASRHDAWFAPLIRIPGKEIPMDRAGAYAGGLVVSHRRDQALVTVDMGGGYGGPLYEHLSANDIDCKGYKGAMKTSRRSNEGKLQFANTRSAAYWGLRELLDPGQPGGSPAMLHPDNQLVSDLTALTFEVAPNGIKVLPKEKVCEILGRSPDDGDSVAMCWFNGPREADSAIEWIENKQRAVRNPKAVLAGPQRVSARRHR